MYNEQPTNASHSNEQQFDPDMEDFDPPSYDYGSEEGETLERDAPTKVADALAPCVRNIQ